MTAVLEVNEIRILATHRGDDWWVLFRQRFEPTGRIRILQSTLPGDVVEVACEDDTHAKELAEMMAAQGVPHTALRVRKLTEGGDQP